MGTTNATNTYALMEDILSLGGEWTTTEINKFVSSFNVSATMMSDYFKGILEGTIQNNILYKKRMEDIEEQIKMFSEFGRSTFYVELEKQRLEFQKQLTSQVADLLAKNVKDISNLTAIVQSYVMEGKKSGKYKDFEDYVDKKHPELVATLKQDIKAINLKAKDLGFGSNYFEDIVENSQDVEESGQKIVDFIVKAKKEVEEQVASAEVIEKQKQFTEGQKNIYNGLTGIMTQLTGVVNLENDWLKSLLIVDDVSVAVKNAFYDLFNVMNLTLNITKKMASTFKEMVGSFDKIYAGFERSGGNLARDQDIVYSASRYGYRYGVQEHEISQSASVLQGGFKGYSSLNFQSRSDLVVLGAMFEKLGVSSSVLSKNMTYFVHALGVGVKESSGHMKELLAYTQSIGMSAKEFADTWSKALDELSMYGERAKEVYKGLSHVAKETGIEMDSLFSLEKKYNVFQNAAELAGKINAIAHRVVLDPMRLMMAQGREKFRLLQDAIRATNFRTNDPRGMMFVAESLGLSPTQIQQIMNAGQPQVAVTKNLEFEEMVRNATELGEKWKSIFKSAAVGVDYVLKGLRYITDLILYLNEITDNWFSIIVFGFIGATVSFFAFVKIMRGLFGIFKGSASVIGSIVKAIRGLGNATANVAPNIANVANATNASSQAVAQLGASATGATAPMATFGGVMEGLSKGAAGMLALGGALLMVALGVAILAYSFKSWNQVAGTVVMFGAAVAILVVASKALSGAAPFMIVAAAAVGILGLALLAVSGAFFVFAKSLEVLANISVGNGLLEVTQFLTQLFGIFLALGALSLVISLFIIPLENVANSIVDILMLFAKIPSTIDKTVEASMRAIKMIVSTMKSIMGGSIFTSFLFSIGGESGLEKIHSAIVSFSDAINHLDSEKLALFSNVLDGMKNVSSMAEDIKSFSSAFELFNAVLGGFKIAGGLEVFHSFGASVAQMSSASFGVIELINRVSGMTTEDVERVSMLTTNLKEISFIMNNTKSDSEITKLIDRTTNLLESQTKIESLRKEGGQSVVINIDGKRVADAILPYIVTKIAPSTVLKT